jgi:hypothetical protein
VVVLERALQVVDVGQPLEQQLDSGWQWTAAATGTSANLARW